MPTNEVGYYGWDVPEGWWKVVWTKDGYASAESAPMEVLPPRFNVDVGLVRLAPPAVSDVVLNNVGGIDVVFDRPMRTFTFEGAYAVTSAGNPVAGTWAAVSPQPGEGDIGDVTNRVRFTPTAPLAVSTSYVVNIAQSLQDYSRRTMTADVRRTLTTAPAGGNGGSNNPAPGAGTGTNPSATPTGTPTASSTPSSGACPALTVGVPSQPALAGRPVTVAVSGLAAGQPVELIGYVRPSTTYRILRSVTLSPQGLAFVTIAPAGNARLAARRVGCVAGASTVLMVRAVLSLAAASPQRHVIQLSGFVLPHRARGVVRLTVRRADGTVALARWTLTDAAGRYSARLVLQRAGRYAVTAKTATDMVVAAGSSPTRFVSVR
jgi:hypothetical protein